MLTQLDVAFVTIAGSELLPCCLRSGSFLASPKSEG